MAWRLLLGPTPYRGAIHALAQRSKQQFMECFLELPSAAHFRGWQNPFRTGNARVDLADVFVICGGLKMGRGGLRFGAGRPGWHVKAEHCLRLDVRDLARRNMLGGGAYTWRWSNTDTGEQIASIGISTGPSLVWLRYATDGQSVCDDVRVVRTACNFGGTRPWFACPRCGGRAAVLYMRSGRFMCRPCGRVVYASQADDAMGRAWRRQAKLEARLGTGWRRPKGMHHATRDRLLKGIWACEEKRDEALEAHLQRLGFCDLLR